LIGQRRRHALAFDARDLCDERDDQRRVDGGRDERLRPDDELVAYLPQLQRGGAWSSRLRRRRRDGAALRTEAR
jgi:hypothetical protein